jgi:hypothetical protein
LSCITCITCKLLECSSCCSRSQLTATLAGAALKSCSSDEPDHVPFVSTLRIESGCLGSHQIIWTLKELPLRKRSRTTIFGCRGHLQRLGLPWPELGFDSLLGCAITLISAPLQADASQMQTDCTQSLDISNLYGNSGVNGEYGITVIMQNYPPLPKSNPIAYDDARLTHGAS